MRRFVVLAHKVPTSGGFSLNDLPGTAGRIDVLCRAVGAGLFVSHGVRTDTEVTLLVQNSVQIRIAGDRVKRLNPDERSTAAILQIALRGAALEEVETTPGVVASQSSLSQVLDRLYQLEAHPVVLHEQGNPIEGFSVPANPAFILSDHEDFTDEDEAALADLPPVSLGPMPLHTRQCITIVHYLLDRDEGDVAADLVLCHKVWGEPKARLITGLLEDFGIPSNLLSHAVPSLYPGMMNGLGEVRIMVRPRDLERARAIIGDYFEHPVDE
ncbi:MAG: tRNA (pseudouridine(54)-N(1))-methyltransferase TrmY [Candidatus Bipolaricaulota bacterium]|nr:tRNA (pseudouridine(54)-N(1))-methyltransferase TrmY [Candidatus Bipolaricaulota bacterium]